MNAVQMILVPIYGVTGTYLQFTVICLIFVAVTFSLTYLITSLQFQIGSIRSNAPGDHEALTVPYWIPFVGSVPSMLNQHRLYTFLAYVSSCPS